MMRSQEALARVNERIVSCARCPRLLKHCRTVAARPPARFRGSRYWAKPVPNFVGSGATGPRVLVVGLAPAAQGGNRTGRMFTGDRSGDFLYRAMYEAGFANQPEAHAIDDGLELRDAVVTAVTHCAPPDNKPLAEEMAHCRAHLEATFDAMTSLRVVVCLGRIAHDAVLRLYKERGHVAALGAHRFAHAALHEFDHAAPVIDSYHPSQQNTFTGRLTPAMLREVFELARGRLD